MDLNRWSEKNNSEQPALNLLEKIHYTTLDGEKFRLKEGRSSLRDVILFDRLEMKLREFNPWISDSNLKRVFQILTTKEVPSVIEFNKLIWEFLTKPLELFVDQDISDGFGFRSQAVKLIEWDQDKILSNDFFAVSQFKVKGIDTNGIPDIIVFINGLPLIVIECKSPLINEPITHAIKDLLFYQSHFPKLFYYNQIVIALSDQAAKYGVIGNSYAHFSEWKEPYPITVDDLKTIVAQTGRKTPDPTPQDILLYGLLEPHNLIDLLRNFTIFEKTSGRLTKKVARYHQYRAVNKTVARILAREEHGGVIWHTQGSGKSLSMVFTSIKLRRLQKLENPLLVFVTDRIDLVDQLQGTFTACGFPNIDVANDWKDLHNLIQQGTGRTIFTNIQKFKKRKRKTNNNLVPVEEEEDYDDEDDSDLKNNAKGCEAFTELNINPNIFVLADEAHRSQYSNFATCMRASMPNAFYIGYTGTPLARDDYDKKTLVGKGKTIRHFGTLIDTYSIRQAVDDGATVQIVYESRMPNLFLEGGSIDKIFDRLFKEKTPEEREEIKKKYSTKGAVLQSKKRIYDICMDILEHYEEFVEPNKFKAQIVVSSRKLTTRYKRFLDELHGPESAIVISGVSKKNTDPEQEDIIPDTLPLLDVDESEEQIKTFTKKTEQRKIIERFKDPNSSLKILIVCDMLITGFDVPHEQVMYLDKGLKEHNLLQAIARVNRTYEKKTRGLIVDYYGVSLKLEEALKIFDKDDWNGVMENIWQHELPLLEQRHAQVMKHFDGLDKTDLEGLVLEFLDDKKKSALYEDIKNFSESMDIVLPNTEGKKYIPDLQFLSKLVFAIRNRTRTEELNITGFGNKVQKIIDDYIQADGIVQLVKPVDLLSDQFFDSINALKKPRSQASEMEHILKNICIVKLDQDPVFYQSLEERLKKIIEGYEQQRITLAEKINRLRALIDEVRQKPDKAKELGLNSTEVAYFNLFKKDLEALDHINQEDIVSFTVAILEEIEPSVRINGWDDKPEVLRQIRKKAKDKIRELQRPWQKKFDQKKLDNLSQEIVTLAKAHYR